MNLQPVKPYNGYMPIVPCLKCGLTTRAPTADLDGEPFVAYYCPACVNALAAEQGEA